MTNEEIVALVSQAILHLNTTDAVCDHKAHVEAAAKLGKLVLEERVECLDFFNRGGEIMVTMYKEIKAQKARIAELEQELREVTERERDRHPWQA